MSKHTPGPWTAVPPQGVTIQSKKYFGAGDTYKIRNETMNDRAWNGYVADIHYTSPNAEDNARLVAAAPDMLEALKGMLDFVEECNAAGCPNTCGYADDARAAIAKAEGKS